MKIQPPGLNFWWGEPGSTMFCLFSKSSETITETTQWILPFHNQKKTTMHAVFMNHNIKEKHDWFLFFYVEHSFKYEDTRTHHDQPIK